MQIRKKEIDCFFESQGVKISQFTDYPPRLIIIVECKESNFPSNPEPPEVRVSGLDTQLSFTLPYSSELANYLLLMFNFIIYDVYRIKNWITNGTTTTQQSYPTC